MVKLVTYRTGWRVYADNRKYPVKGRAKSDFQILVEHDKSIARQRARLDSSCKQLSLYDPVSPVVPSLSKQPKPSSVNRARLRLFEIACCNNWEYFATFTVAGDDDSAIKDVLGFFNDFNRNHKCSIKYLGVFERGDKHGRLHFHVLLMDVPSYFLCRYDSSEYAGLPYRLKKYYSRSSVSNRLYYCPSWTSRSGAHGFCSIIKINSSPALCSYLTKYMSPVAKFGRYFMYRSRNLNLPTEQYIDLPFPVEYLELLCHHYKHKDIQFKNFNLKYSVFYGDGSVDWEYKVHNCYYSVVNDIFLFSRRFLSYLPVDIHWPL